MQNIKNFSLKGLNLDVLKVVALIAMTFDHVGHVLFPTVDWLRIVGRLTFPIFAYLFCLHLNEKQMFRKYALRMLPFALISTILLVPCDIILKGYLRLNIFWLFLLSLWVISICQTIASKRMCCVWKWMFFFVLFLVAMSLSIFMDYSIYGFLFILGLYGWFHTKHVFYMILFLVNCFLMNYGGFGHISILPFIYGITGVATILFLLWQRLAQPKSDKRFLKPWWVFYAYYPIHFFVLYLIYIFFFI